MSERPEVSAMTASPDQKPTLQILGCRGVPSAHGGFETFAQELSVHLAEQGWEVLVYCQVDHDPDEGAAPPVREDTWRGVRRLHLPVTVAGPLGTLQFDIKCLRESLRRPGLHLVLGYNSAILNVVSRLRGRTVLMNMDGIEWKRGKWAWPVKAWFWVNERIGSLVSHIMIADHPRIVEHLCRFSGRTRQRIKMIPYGAASQRAPDTQILEQLGLEPHNYLVTVCRIEPENSILEIVRAFSSARRPGKLVIVGPFWPETRAYDRQVRDAASDQVVFAGPVYDQNAVFTLRNQALAYCHGHTVGGTNPSLVEALGARCAVIARDNDFNRWVAGEGQFFFGNETECAGAMSRLFDSPDLAAGARAAAAERYAEAFEWSVVLSAYEDLLLRTYRERVAEPKCETAGAAAARTSKA